MDIEVYFEDGEAGQFFTSLAENEMSSVLASDGHVFYATKKDDWTRISQVIIHAGVDEYSFRRQQDASQRVKLNAASRNTPNPYIVPLNGPRSTAIGVKFRNLSSRKVELWFDDGRGGITEGHLTSGQETTTNAYEGHVFFVTLINDKNTEIGRFTITSDQVLYLITDEEYPASKDILQKTEREVEFMKKYREENGIHWTHYFGPHGPRSPPLLYMWPADYVGEVHKVLSAESYWNCQGNKKSCQSQEELKLELEVVSLEPRALLIENFASTFETEELIRLGSSQLRSSSVGDFSAGVFNSDTRTSSNSWIPRSKSPVTETIYRRAADVLQIDEDLLSNHKNAEQIQLVSYEHGQKYDAHHDWGVNGKPESRYITLLVYLTDQASKYAGGETSFPKGVVMTPGVNGTRIGEGFKVIPKKGNAVIFYNLLADGNGDDLSLHASLPVREGKKWLANIWIWDPKFH